VYWPGNLFGKGPPSKITLSKRGIGALGDPSYKKRLQILGGYKGGLPNPSIWEYISPLLPKIFHKKLSPQKCVGDTFIKRLKCGRQLCFKRVFLPQNL